MLFVGVLLVKESVDIIALETLSHHWMMKGIVRL